MLEAKSPHFEASKKLPQDGEFVLSQGQLAVGRAGRMEERRIKLLRNSLFISSVKIGSDATGGN